MEHGAEGGGGAADVGGGGFEAAEILHDLGYIACGDALDVHFDGGDFECLFATLAAFEGAGIERVGGGSDLWDSEGEFTGSGV